MTTYVPDANGNPPTRAQYDAIMATRTRPLTDGPMRLHRMTDDDTPNTGRSLIDAYLAAVVSAT